MRTNRFPTQQEFLRSAMRVHGLTRTQLAAHVGATPHRLNSWLLPTDAPDYKDMDLATWKSIRAIPSTK